MQIVEGHLALCEDKDNIGILRHEPISEYVDDDYLYEPVEVIEINDYGFKKQYILRPLGSDRRYKVMIEEPRFGAPLEAIENHLGYELA